MADTRRLVWDIFAIDRASKTFDRIADRGEHMGGRIGRVAGLMTGALVGAATLGVGALAGAFGEGLKGAAEYQKVTAQTTAVLKSTRDVSQTTALGVRYLSESISEYSGVSRDVVQSGANMLLTFTNIKDVTGKGGDVFDRATKTLVDMTTALGEDPKKAAIQLGKALNDPVKGATALRRVGVQLDAQQQKSIKTFMAHGQIMKAQNVILGELQKEFGGSAKAAGETFAGSLKRLKNSFLELLQDAITPLLPYLTQFVGWLADKLPAASKALGQAIGWVKGQFQSSGGAVSKMTGLFASLWGWVKEKLLPAYEHYYQQVMPALKGAVKSVTDTLSKHKDIFVFLGTVLTQIILPIIGQVAKAVLTVLGPAFKMVAWIASNVVIPALKFLIGMWINMVSYIIDGAAKAFGWIPGIGPKLKKAAADFDRFRIGVNAALTGIKDQTVNLKVVASINGSTKMSNQQKKNALDDVFRASGGPVTAGQPYIVGEEGPELFVPGQSGGIVPNGKTSRSGAAGGGNIYITVNHHGVSTPADDLRLAKTVEKALIRLRRVNGRPLGFA